MAGRGNFLLTMLCFGACAAAPPFTAYSLAGRYTARFDNATIEGERYTSIDEVVIAPTDARHAHFYIHTYFLNGSECEVGGLATLEGGALVFRNPDERGYEGRSCELRIERQGSRLTWDDRGSCSAYCGMRGRLSDGSVAWSSRRPVTRSERARVVREHERERHLR